MKKILLTLLLLTLSSWANDYNKGVDAYNSGDYVRAIMLWEPYAKEGNVKAQFTIGKIYYEGLGVQQNYRKAMYWYKQAADQEYAKAYAQLGLMYIKGQGVLKSYKKAVPYIQLAFDNGCKFAPEIWNKYELWKYE